MQEIIGNIVMITGMIFMLFGIIGIYKFNDFYTRLMAASKADVVGALTLMIGLVINHGFSYFTGKILLLIAIMLIFNPLIAHVLARSAYLSEKEEGGTS